ncbi:MAG: hypothetical protein ABUS47_14165 [Steroidobacter sp.]
MTTSCEFDIRECTAGRAGTRLILSNGSERGDYIPCTQVQKQFASPHDGVQLLKAYYPSDPKWTNRLKISQAHPNPAATYAWDHDYDDYWPLDFDVENGSVERQLHEIKMIGADVHLTLSLDMSLSDAELVQLFSRLAGYGVVYLRINHEANGAWFRHHKLHTRKEISDFFVRCHKLIQCHAPNIKTVFSLTADIFVGNQVNSVVTRKLACLDQAGLREALAIADYWSLDKYVTLNWGWPHTHPAQSDNYFSGSIDTWWRLIEETYLLMIHCNGGIMKPLFLHEFNSDADVVGEAGQAEAITTVYKRILQSDFPWLEGICFYQYCDEGGLGLIKGRNGDFTATRSLPAYAEVLKQYVPPMTIADMPWPHAHFAFAWPHPAAIKGIALTLSAPAGQFTNRFNAAVYLVEKDNWRRLESGETASVSDVHLQVFMPPRFAGGCLRHVTTVHDVRTQLAACLRVNHQGTIS